MCQSRSRRLKPRMVETTMTETRRWRMLDLLDTTAAEAAALAQVPRVEMYERRVKAQGRAEQMVHERR